MEEPLTTRKKKEIPKEGGESQSERKSQDAYTKPPIDKERVQLSQSLLLLNRKRGEAEEVALTIGERSVYRHHFGGNSH